MKSPQKLIPRVSPKKASKGFQWPKRSRIKKKPRKPSETLRIYGGKKRIGFVKSLPCAACGAVGDSENAHVAPPSEKGTGYKAGYRFIVPLCNRRQPCNGHYGCHMALHAWGMEKFQAEFPDFHPEEAAAETELLWQSEPENLWLEHSKEKA